MRIAVIIPDRGDRPAFLSNCLRMVRAQTLPATTVKIIDYEPVDEKCDISARYRTGYKAFDTRTDIDLIAFMENDDWYAPVYLETMAALWEKHGRPDIFGTNHTIYYHIKLRGYFTFHHFDRASAMNTFLKPRLDIHWPPDFEPYTDMHLWRSLKGISVDPGKIISIGIKHGDGRTGGGWHRDNFDRFKNEDKDFSFLRRVMDPQSFDFYTKYFENVPA